MSELANQPNFAAIQSMNQHQNNSSGHAHALPSASETGNGGWTTPMISEGLDGHLHLQDSSINFANIGGLNEITATANIENFDFGAAMDGAAVNPIGGMANSLDAVRQISAMGNVELGKATSAGSALNMSEGGHSFGNVSVR